MNARSFNARPSDARPRLLEPMMSLRPCLGAAAAAATLLLLPAVPAHAAVLQTLGHQAGGGVVGVPVLGANFEANTSLASPWAEGGLLFSHTGLGDDNGGCGYAGEWCVDLAAGERYSRAFSGNHFATAGLNAYLSISSGATVDMNGINFAVDSGYLSIHLLWQTWRDGALTGSGRVSVGAAGHGGVLGLRDLDGFDEVRLYAFDSAADTAGYSVPAIDSVRASAIPLPGSLPLVLAALAAMAGVAAPRGARARP